MDITKLSVLPDDLLIVSTDQVMDRDAIGYLRTVLGQQFKDAGFSNKVIFLTAGFKIEVLRRAA